MVPSQSRNHNAILRSEPVEMERVHSDGSGLSDTMARVASWTCMASPGSGFASRAPSEYEPQAPGSPRALPRLATGLNAFSDHSGSMASSPSAASRAGASTDLSVHANSSGGLVSGGLAASSGLTATLPPRGTRLARNTEGSCENFLADRGPAGSLAAPRTPRVHVKSARSRTPRRSHDTLDLQPYKIPQLGKPLQCPHVERRNGASVIIIGTPPRPMALSFLSS